MIKWKEIWAVIKGDQLDGEKALNRNAGIGLFLLGIMLLNVIRSGKVSVKPLAVVIICTAFLFCYSWLVGRNDEIRRNKLLVIQGILAIPLIMAAAVWFIITLHAIAHPEPGTEKIVSRMGYPPGLIAGALFYFGRHISDFSKKFKLKLNKYIMLLLAIALPLEVITLVKFFEVITVMFASI